MIYILRQRRECLLCLLCFTSVQQDEAPTVHVAATLFQEMCYQNKDQLSAGIIVAGWDKKKGGTVYNIPLGGALIQQPFAIGGSGSTYIYGYCDSKYRDNMSREECIEFVQNCKWSLIYISRRQFGSKGWRFVPLFSSCACYVSRRFFRWCYSYGCHHWEGCRKALCAWW